MTSNFNSAIVRIRAESDHVVGAGFLVGEREVLTCAHVVTDALGLPDDTPTPPQADLPLDFPLLAPEPTLTARVSRWHPVIDVAVLELTTDSPARSKPIRLVTADNLWGHAFRAFGFPAGYEDGVWTSGVLRGRIGSGWVQIEDVKEPGYWVQPGFSGTPIWDEQLGGVVGMAVAADRDPERKAAYMIPVDALVEALPDLVRAKVIPTQAVVDERSVLFDEGHGQRKWGVDWDSERPLVSHDYKSFADIIRDLHLHPVQMTSLKQEALKPAPLLVLVLPFEARYSLDEVRSIKGFVRAGGGLLAISYYGGDDHFQTNLNEVLEAFGITTASDRVRDAKASWENAFELTAYAAPGNGLLPEGEKLFIPLCCSLALDVGKNPSAKPIVQSSENSLTQTIKRVEGRVRDFIPKSQGRQVLGAVARYGLGRIAVLGSWQAFTTVSLTKEGFANSHLLEVLLKWLIKEDTDAADRA